MGRVGRCVFSILLAIAPAAAPAQSEPLPHLARSGDRHALIVDGAELHDGFATAARNIPDMDVLPIQGINVYDILRRQKLVLTKAAIDALEARFK